MTDWYFSHIVLVQSTLTTLLLALSVQVPLRAGVFSFAGVGCYGIGGYLAAIGMVHYGLSTASAILLAAAAGGIAAYALGLLIQRLTGLYLAMATVAFTLIIAVVVVNGGDLTGSAAGLFGALGTLDTGHLLAVVAVVVVALTFTEIGPLGRRVEAVREDPELASAMGIDVARYRRATFAVSGVLGGLSGSMTVLLRSTVTPDDINFHLVVLALTIIIVGGSRSWIGAFVGTVIFVWMPEVLAFVGEWEDVVYGVLVAAAAVYLPGGVTGAAMDGYRRYRRKRREAQSSPDAPPPQPAAAAAGGDR
ncbi:branched-chain amino acid ABC transporter permease [Prauserella rugosa]|uniref:Branched-chain amino acid transport system permease protein n=1 Tax=Prauserella rugosa TaxID=43354 RepID=A0A660C7W3_9PSEU|nr:branched-chain amino acid ABC transporter permease [Prauserella rugosa]TWH19660.1 branched-chain amino acid transport system permease protein [Prauserella rugosa]